MKQASPEYIPVNGKTYSLFANSQSTEGYYRTVSAVADMILAKGTGVLPYWVLPVSLNCYGECETAEKIISRLSVFL